MYCRVRETGHIHLSYLLSLCEHISWGVIGLAVKTVSENTALQFAGPLLETKDLIIQERKGRYLKTAPGRVTFHMKRGNPSGGA